MPLKLVAYDLTGTDGDFSALDQEMLAFPLCQRVQPSVWMIHCDLDVLSLRDRLLIHVSEGDNLMVCEVSDWAASGRAYQSAGFARRRAA